MRFNRVSLIIAALMFAASIGAASVRGYEKHVPVQQAFSLDTMIPKRFGDWQEEPDLTVRVINPQYQAGLDELYNQVLTRNYVSADGYRIMLSVAYGSDQRGSFRAHDPEACYSAAGFALTRMESSPIVTPFGEIPVKRLFATKGPRNEPVTYWWKVGNRAVPGWQRRLAELSHILTGRIPDGLLFRVSSIDSGQTRANQYQDQFINQLLGTLAPAERQRLSGLGEF